MSLAHLSLARFKHCACKRPYQPHVPTNTERLQALRAALLPTVGNAYPWPHLRMERKA